MITREDLSPGYQATQAIHAAVSFASWDFNHEAIKRWNRGGHLVVLTTRDEDALYDLSINLGLYGIGVEEFREPDIDNELTAIAFLASKVPNCVSKLPLALRTPDDPRFLREREIRNSLREEVS